jgi:localization factor PodJL
MDERRFMKSNVPWSVKGIDPEARVVAKEAARKAGMTLGEWMTTMINEVGTDSPDATEGQTGQASTGVTTDQLRAVVDSLNRLNERLKNTEENLKRSEEKSREVVGGLNQGLETVFERIKRVEREKATGTPAELDDRLQKLETSAQDRERIESLKALEAALSQMVEQFESTRREAIERVGRNEEAVSALAGRVDTLDRRLTAGFEEVHDALDTVTSHLDQTERTAKAVMLEAREAANSSDEEFVERTGKKLQLLGNEIKRSGDQIAAVEQLVSALSQKIEAAERRSAEGIESVAEDLDALRQELEASLAEDVGGTEPDGDDGPKWKQAAAEAEETVASLQRSYDNIIAQLEGRAPAQQASATDAADQGDDDIDDEGPKTTTAAASATTSALVEDPDAEFDAVFADTAGEAEAADPAQAAEDEALAAEADTDEDDSAETPSEPNTMSPREKILAAAKARQERLARERADREDISSPEPLTAATAPVSTFEDDPDVDTGTNRRLGLPLVALLGLGLVGMIFAATMFFGFGDSPSDAPVAEDEVVADTPAAPTRSLPASAGSELPDIPAGTSNGVALYQQGKELAAAAQTLDERAEAFALIREAAIYGHVPAQYRLGEMYSMGMGTEQNLQNAKRWFTEAAMSGNAAAMHRLGTLAFDPNVDGQNFNQAIEWFTRAANYGVIDSMYNLGYLFDPTSDLLPSEMRNAEQSYYWYALATRQGDLQAPIDGANVANRLSPERVAAIEADVAEWQPNPVDEAVNDGLQIVN